MRSAETAQIFFVAPRDVAGLFRSAGGSDELSNRTTLRVWHHLRGVHAGRVRCTGAAPEGLRFELGLRGGKPPLLDYRTARAAATVAITERSTAAA